MGLLFQAGTACDGFSPLASGLVRASFTFTAGASTSLAQRQPQRARADGPHSQSITAVEAARPAAGPSAAAGLHEPPLSAGQGHEGAAVELADGSYCVLDRAWSAPIPSVPGGGTAAATEHQLEQPRPMSQMTDRSRRSHSEMECDLRSSWGSERSADVQLPWRGMQACLHEQFAQVRRKSHEGGFAATSAASPDDTGMQLRGSTDSLLRDSLELPSCTERQASLVPLRTSIRGHWQHKSHLHGPSPGGGSASTADVLPQHQSVARHKSPAAPRPRSSAQKHHHWGKCFGCHSPFSSCISHQQQKCEDDDAEVVRRADSEEFVLHRTQSFHADLPSRGRQADGKPRRESLNRPPSPAALVNRQDGFSAKCCFSPVHLLSPQSACSDEDAPCYGRSLPEQFEQAPSSQELLACLRDQSRNPTVDELNDMLRSFCTLDLHPKDAEELVTEASKTFQLAPNAATLRTLDKIWAAHDQMYN
ncbi:hypothetical protein N2152v2_008619 [Parachlorella kessleri]